MNFPFYLARRFFGETGRKGKRQASSPAISVATFGIAVGLAVMILSVCVVKGFQQEVNRKLTGFASHIEVLSPHYFQSPEDAPITVTSQFLKEIKESQGIAHAQRISQKIGVLKTEREFQGIALKGLAEEYDTTFLHSALLSGRLPDLKKEQSNELTISQRQAQALGLKVGDQVFSYFFENTIKMRRFKVVGIYETNLKQFDDNFAITTLGTVNQLNSWSEKQCSEIEVHVQDFDLLEAMKHRVSRLVNQQTDKTGEELLVLSVKEDPRISGTFAWLNLLDMNVWIILALMVLVAGFTMVSGLLILILERTSTIGLLKAMGATNHRIRTTFLYFATFIVIRGLIIGDILALAIIFLQKHFGIIRLNPASYYVDKAPVVIDWYWIAGLNVATLLVTFFALLVPSYMVSRIQPAKSIRFE